MANRALGVTGDATGAVVTTDADILRRAPVPSTGSVEGAVFVSNGTGGTLDHLYFREPNDGALHDLLAGGGGGDLAATLILGNVTGANDIVVNNGQAVVGEPAAPASGLAGKAIVVRGGLGDGVGLRGPVVLDALTGAIQARTTGNTRGRAAVDLQVANWGATSVASGRYSTILGGAGNKAAGQYASVLGGYGNYVYSKYAASIGSTRNYIGSIGITGYNVGSAQHSVGLGGTSNRIYAVKSSVIGNWNYVGPGQILAPHGYVSSFRSEVLGNYNYSYSRQTQIIGDFNWCFNPDTMNPLAAYQPAGLSIPTLDNVVIGAYNLMSPPYGSPLWFGMDPDSHPFGWQYQQSTLAWRDYITPKDGLQRNGIFGTVNVGYHNVVQASCSTTLGLFTLGTVSAQLAIGSGKDANTSVQATGTHQVGIAALHADTVWGAGGEVDMYSGASADARLYFTLRQQTSYTFRILVTAREVADWGGGPVPSTGDSASWEFTGIIKRDEYTQAKGTITVTGGGPFPAGDTITIGTVTLTSVIGAPGANQFDVSSGNTSLIANNIRNAIQAPVSTTGAGHKVPIGSIWQTFTEFPTVAANVVRLAAWPVGAAGNAVAFSTTNAARYVLTGAGFLSGGVDTTVTMVGISSAGLTAPNYSDGLAGAWRVAVSAQNASGGKPDRLNIQVTGADSTYIKWEAMILTAEAGRQPWNF